MKNLTLRQLRVFAAAARHMNFSRAAEELHLSQPAVSTQIKEFASHVGLPLFERIGRKSFLTPAGEEMLQCARAITQRLKEAEETLAQLKGVTGGRLNVAVISAGDYFFPRVLAAFGAEHPGITFNLTVHNREGLLRQLAGNLVVLDVQGFPALLNWYLVHNRSKRLPPVAAAFKDFLMRQGAPLIERLVHFELSGAPQRPPRGRRARGRRAS